MSPAHAKEGYDVGAFPAAPASLMGNQRGSETARQRYLISEKPYPFVRVMERKLP